MNRAGRTGSVVALALTWDGSRWPIQTLPPKARAFLSGSKAPSAQTLAKLFAEDQIGEIRVCWIPHLKGGWGILSESFQTPTGKRIRFRSVKTVRFGDILGVIYRRRF